MQFFFSNSLLIGLEIAASKFRVAIIKQFKGIFQIEDVKEYFFDPLNVNPLYKQTSSQILKNSIVSSSLDSRDVLIRQLELPLMKQSDIASAIEFQVEPLLPYPIENSILQHAKITQNPSGSLMTILSVKKDKLESHLNSYRLLCEPDVVSCFPHALACLFNQFFYQKEASVLLHLNAQQASLVLLEEGKLLSAKSFDSAHLNIEGEAFYKELCKAIYSLEAQFKNKKFESLFLLGTQFQNQKILSKIEQATQKKACLASSPRISDDVLHQFGLTIGIALTGHQSEINFRQKEFSHPNPWKKEKKSAALYFILATALAGGMFLFGQLKLEEQKSLLQNQYIELLAKENKPINEEVHNPLTPEELQQKLISLEKEIRSRPDLYPYLPGVPKVSDILAWISTHPQIAASIDSKDAPILIEGFHYNLVKLPNLSHKKDHYQLKIDLEFTAANPSIARSLHDALLSNNSIVDSKQEVQWNSSKGRYRASFYVKDKTRYN